MKRIPGLRAFLLASSVAANAACAGTLPAQTTPAPSSPPSSPSCARLAVGQAVSASGPAAASICVQAAGAEEFVLVPFNGAAEGQLRVDFGGTGLAAMETALSAPFGARLAFASRRPASSYSFASRPPPSAAMPLLPPAAPRWREGQAEAEAALRERERREVLPRFPAARADAALRPPRTAPDPKVGDTLRINVGAAACDSADLRLGRVAAVGTRSVVVADAANPAGGLTAADYRGVAATFDSLVHPLATSAFGEPSDIDGNRRVLLFFTRAVNERAPEGSSAYTVAFVMARDLLPRRAASPANAVAACPASNAGEVFYLLAADPDGQVNGNVFPREMVLERSVGAVMHEFQHLINASRRLYVLKDAVREEEPWLNEGLSHVAEELLFYRAASLSPGRNIDSAAAHRTRDAFQSYAFGNFQLLNEFFRAPNGAGPYGPQTPPAVRGAAWSFLRYAADRKGGDQAKLWYALVNSGRAGQENLRAVLGADPAEWMADWAVSLYADDAVKGTDARFREPSWDARSILTDEYQFFPLRVRTMSDAGSIPLRLSPGATSFLRFAVHAGGTATLRTTVPGGAVPPTLRVTVLRTR